MKIRVDGLSSFYQGQPCLREISLAIEEGEILALLGPNGCGKTTLLKHLSGVLRSAESATAVQLDMRALSSYAPRELARVLAAVEQHIVTGFDFSVREVVELGRLPHLRRWERMGSADRDAVARALEQTEIGHLASRSLFQLSSGERQRVWLAMALAQEPQVLLLDEPTSHLDLRYQMETFALLQRFAAEGLTVVVAIHNVNLTLLYADRAALLADGALVAVGTPQEVLTPEHVRRVFGVEMRPVNDDASGRLVGLLPVVGMRIRDDKRSSRNDDQR